MSIFVNKSRNPDEVKIESIKIGIISDTHNFLPGDVAGAFRGVKCIFHAGDIGNQGIIRKFNKIAPTRAVTATQIFTPSLPVFIRRLPRKSEV